MRTMERLHGLKAWCEKNLCEGREMKAPAPNMDISKIVRQKPECYLAWAPSRMDSTGQFYSEASSVCPGIIIMPNQSYGKYMEEKRFDRYNNVHRPPNLGQHLSVSILFSVYEPGIRLPGFIHSVGPDGQGLDMSLIKEGTEEGLAVLCNWTDDCMECLLRDRSIPGTDLFLKEETMTYSLYTDQKYVVDARPIYYGFINVTFGCYANEGVNSAVKDMLN